MDSSSHIDKSTQLSVNHSPVFSLICLVAELRETQSLSNSSMGGAPWKHGHKILGKGEESWIN